MELGERGRMREQYERYNMLRSVGELMKPVIEVHGQEWIDALLEESERLSRPTSRISK